MPIVISCKICQVKMGRSIHSRFYSAKYSHGQVSWSINTAPYPVTDHSPNITASGGQNTDQCFIINTDMIDEASHDRY